MQYSVRGKRDGGSGGEAGAVSVRAENWIEAAMADRYRVVARMVDLL